MDIKQILLKSEDIEGVIFPKDITDAFLDKCYIIDTSKPPSYEYWKEELKDKNVFLVYHEKTRGVFFRADFIKMDDKKGTYNALIKIMEVFNPNHSELEKEVESGN